MTDDELLLIYKGLREMTEAMKAREIALDAKTAALNTAIAQLGKLPDTLGQHTSHYIAIGVRQSIQDDFSRPISDAVKGPIADLGRATYQGQRIMEQVSREVRFQSWTWVGVLLLIGFSLGGATAYYAFVRDVNRVDEQIDLIEQYLARQMPASDAKPSDGRVGRDHKHR